MSNYSIERDAAGRVIATTYAADPTSPFSYRYEYDADGYEIARTYAADPKHPNNWRRL